MFAYARAAHGDDADDFIRPVAEFGAQGGAIAERTRVETRDIPGEIEVLCRPVADRRQVASEGLRHDVVGIADEDRSVAQARVPRDLLDHLGIVICCKKFFGLPAVRHREPPDKIGHPDIRRTLLFRILVQEIVELPRFVADPQIVRFVAHDVMKHHEVVHQDLIHAPQGLKCVEVVFGRFAFDVLALAGQKAAGRVNALAARLEYCRHRVLCEPIYFKFRTQSPQFVGDCDVAQRVTQADRRGDIQRAPRSFARHGPPSRGIAVSIRSLV